MGWLRLFIISLLSIFIPSLRPMTLIESQIFGICKYMNWYPERDKHAWLAMTLKARYPNLDERTCYIMTVQFSILPIKDAPLALGMYLIYKERPSSAIPYSETYFKMLAPVWELINKKKFVDAWKKENPWTAEHQPWLVDALKKSEELGFDGLVQLGESLEKFFKDAG